MRDIQRIKALALINLLWIWVLVDLIYNDFNSLDKFDWGTKSKTGTECGLDRGNIQYPGIVDSFSKSKFQDSIFLVDLKAQSIHQEKNGPIRMITKFLG